MAKRWWTFNFTGVDWSDFLDNVGFSAPWWTEGMTIVRMLFSLQITGNVVDYSTLRNYSFPPVIAFIGYDPTTDHTGDHINPVDNPGEDWLYTEQFTNRYAIGKNADGTVDIAITAGTQNPVSLEGQRKLGANVAPFLGFRWHAAAGAAPELWLTFTFPYMRVLVEDHGL